MEECMRARSLISEGAWQAALTREKNCRSGDKALG